MNTRRRIAIEYLCKCFITRENENVEFLRQDYAFLVHPIISRLGLNGMDNLEEAIVNIGEGIFETRPAKMAYVCAFMEFICKIAENNQSISQDDIIRISADVIENTDFKIPTTSFLRTVVRIAMGVFNIFVNATKY